MQRALGLLVATGAMVAGCRASTLGTGRQADLAPRRDELRATIAAAATRMANGEFVTPLSEAFAATGVYVATTPLSARGPANARAWLVRDTLNALSRARWTVVRHEVSADGRDGYAYGYFDVIRASGDTLFGRYHSYWRRETDGVWRMLAFSRGRRAAGPVDTAVPAWVQAPTTGSRFAGADTIVALRGLFATERAFSDSAGTSVQAAFVGFAAPDAAKLERGSSYGFGPSAIGELFAGPPPPGGGPLWSPEVGAVATSGDLGFTTGPVTARRPAEGAAPPGAKYFTIWRRMPNGDWRYVVD
jgi:ketosteroid isomerase-like protein